MNRWNKTAKFVAIGCLSAAMIAVAGCGGATNSGASKSADGTDGSTVDKTEAQPAAAVSKEPVKLKVYFFQPGFVDADFNEKFLPYLNKKFPQITYELVNTQKGVSIEDIVASGDVPDLIEAGEKEVPKLSVLGVPEDLNGLIKQNKIDMNKLQPVLNSSLKKYSDKGESLAMMFAMQNFATFYNKDIFDKFGVPYPKDGMSWDDLAGLARRLTREVDGQQYYGIQAGNGSALAQKFGLDTADVKMKKALFNNPGWHKVYELGKLLYTIPGNLPPKGKFNTVTGIFTKDRNVAIAPYYTDGFINNLQKLLDQGNPINYDISTHPTFADNPGHSHELSFRSFVVSKTSKHKAEAFQVAAYISTSDEIQTHLSKDGYGASLKDDKYKKIFGENRTVLKGKNVAAIFKTSPLDIHHINKYDDAAKKALDQPFYDFVSGKIDENTSLRLAQEAADKAIADIN
jgi:multiple sugar transport system substrate-binding protein